MGKYMRKAKISGEVAVMEVQHPSPLGVRTRAKTLALQRLQKSPSTAEDPSSYLQLRSRRLEKHFASPASTVAAVAKARNANKSNPRTRSLEFNPSPKVSTNNKIDESPVNSGSATSANCCSWKQNALEMPIDVSTENDAGIEVSLGENVPDFETTRASRETTPCSLIRDPEAIGTPGSTTRQTTSAANTRRMRPSGTCDIPTALEMEEFFAGPEQAQQRRFAQKYNFDPVTEQPLPGRYEWEKLDP